MIRSKALDIQNELTKKLHTCYIPISVCLLAILTMPLPKGRKLIEFIYPKNNNYPLTGRAYERDKTLVLTKAHGFYIVASPKKIINPFGSAINNFANNATILKNISSD